MEFLADHLRSLAPAFVVVLGTIAALVAIRIWYRRRRSRHSGLEFRRQIVTIAIYLVGVLAIALVLPMDDERRGQLLGLIGVLLSAMVALSSTSVLGNAMAGLMLRAQRVFRPGDFLQVEEHFGRVSERGLFHTEIQTEARDLTTLPNLYLSARPLTVLRSPGTLVSSTVSLGYDVPRQEIEAALLAAAEAADLSDPFVRILELGDFSVTYRVSGLLGETKRIVSTRSRLNARVLDRLHDAGIEIVSPNFMNQRALAAGDRVLPSRRPAPESAAPDSVVKVESLMFDKAEAAGVVERLRDVRLDLEERVAELKKRLMEAGDGEEREELRRRIANKEARLEWLAGLIERRSGGNE